MHYGSVNYEVQLGEVPKLYHVGDVGSKIEKGVKKFKFPT